MCELDPHVNFITRKGSNKYQVILCHDYDIASNDENFFFTFGDEKISHDVVVPQGSNTSKRNEIICLAISKLNTEYESTKASIEFIKINGSCRAVAAQCAERQNMQ